MPGKAIGSVDENILKRAQIRRTIEAHFDKARVDELLKLGWDRSQLENYDVDQYVDLYVKDKMITL